MTSIDDRTGKALGSDVMEKLRSLHFCIVGCGGTGASFAEMLVRTGATHLTLIDGTCIEESNLNRVFSFFPEDCGEAKVDVLKKRLESIRPGHLQISTFRESFRTRANSVDPESSGQEVRDAVQNADVVFVGTDTNRSRRAIEQLCRYKVKEVHLSCGVRFDPGADCFEFECNWGSQTCSKLEQEEGYGPENASFASVVLEAVSVAFTMLLSHLKCKNSSFKSYYRRYDAKLQPDPTTPV